MDYRVLTTGILDPERETALDEVLATLELPAGRFQAQLGRGGTAEVIDLGVIGVRVTVMPTASSRAERSPDPRGQRTIALHGGGLENSLRWPQSRSGFPARRCRLVSLESLTYVIHLLAEVIGSQRSWSLADSREHPPCVDLLEHRTEGRAITGKPRQCEGVPGTQPRTARTATPCPSATPGE